MARAGVPASGLAGNIDMQSVIGVTAGGLLDEIVFASTTPFEVARRESFT